MKAKPFVISKQLVMQAYRLVKANRGAAGPQGPAPRPISSVSRPLLPVRESHSPRTSDSTNDTDCS